MQLIYEKITESIIGAAFEVYKILGYGFLEKVYQRAMQVELHERGHIAELEPAIKVKYKKVIVGDYASDILVDSKVVVELKVAKRYNPKDEPQLLNILMATGMKVGMLINFGRDTVEFKRFVY